MYTFLSDCFETERIDFVKQADFQHHMLCCAVFHPYILSFHSILSEELQMPNVHMWYGQSHDSSQQHSAGVETSAAQTAQWVIRWGETIDPVEY